MLLGQYQYHSLVAQSSVEIIYPYARTNVYCKRLGFSWFLLPAKAIGKAQARIVRDLKKCIAGRKLEKLSENLESSVVLVKQND